MKYRFFYYGRCLSGLIFLVVWFTPVTGQVFKDSTAYEIIYQQIFNFTGIPDTSSGVLRNAENKSVYDYGRRSGRVAKLLRYTDPHGNDHQVLQAADRGDSVGYSIYKNLSKRTVVSREKVVNEYFIVYDAEQIEWEIAGQSKNISGYAAFNARCHFRGRDYEAWFTKEIPVLDGPWKFSGLPGLILQVSDNTGEVSFSAIAIQPQQDNSVNIIPPSDYPEFASYISFLEHQKKLEQADEMVGIKAATKKNSTITFKRIKLEM
ncbi:GLPGLI family protein [Pedobacter antarcticus]|uniref:GLPGLI family protein n=1 Tax=Pedobacter antarcticus TaxID=34086 RepID=UPI001C5A1B27|nr:GLPGLI family protein [Pedobacter antarcticus]